MFEQMRVVDGIKRSVGIRNAVAEIACADARGGSNVIHVFPRGMDSAAATEI